MGDELDPGGAQEAPGTGGVWQVGSEGSGPVMVVLGVR